ncbi:MCP four helix bundle domain-containing protein, partial [Sphingomonas sp. RS6]
MLASINNWPLAKKMLVAFSFLAALTAAMAINGWISNRNLTQIARNHVEHSVASMSTLTDVMSEIKEMRIIVYSFYNAADQKDADKLQSRIEASSRKLDDRIKELGDVADPSFAPQIAELKTIKSQLDDVNKRIFEASQVDKATAIKLIKGDGKARSHDAIAQTEKLLSMSREAADDANQSGNAQSFFSLILTLGLSALSFGALASVWLVINRTVATPMASLARATKMLAEGGKADVPSRGRGDELGDIAEAVEQFRLAAVNRAEIDARTATEQKMVTEALRESLTRVTAGDLTADVRIEFPPAYAELKSNLNNALASLRDLIGSVLESTASIRTGSNEIAQASEDLARRTEANAASLEETAAAV